MALPRRARAARSAAPGRDHLPGPRARHHAARLEAGAGRRGLPRDARLQRLLQPAAGRPRRRRARAPIELRGLDVGKYYWRVAAVDKDDVEGSFSDFARFTVSRPQGGRAGRRPAAPRSSTPSTCAPTSCRCKGRTEPGATVTVNGQRVDVASGRLLQRVHHPRRSPAARRWSSAPPASTAGSPRRSGRWWWRSSDVTERGWRSSAGRRPEAQPRTPATRDGLAYEFFPRRGLSARRVERGLRGGARRAGPRALARGPRALRRGPARASRWAACPCAATPRILQRSRGWASTSTSASWRTRRSARAARCSPTSRPRARGKARPAAPATPQLNLRTTTQRLAILTDIVKTANSILEPRKVIELIMAKIQQLIPSEAWSMLMVDEEKQELTFELALGEKGKDVAVVPGEDRGGHRGLGGADGQAHHRQRHLQGPALRAALRHQDPVPDALHPVRAPHLARAHHRGGGDHQQARRPVHARPTWRCC